MSRGYRHRGGSPGGAEDDDLAERWEVVLDGVASTQREVLKQIEANRRPGPMVRLLQVLLRALNNRLPMTRLARDLWMTSSGFTKLADRIARKGLIDRRGSSGDRRVVYAMLTDRGLQVAQRATRVYHSALRVHILDVVSLASVTTLARLMHALHEANRGTLPMASRPPGRVPPVESASAKLPRCRPAEQRPAPGRQGA